MRGSDGRGSFGHGRYVRSRSSSIVGEGRSISDPADDLEEREDMQKREKEEGREMGGMEGGREGEGGQPAQRT